MTYEGHVENGVIVLDGAVALEEGTRVRIEISTHADKVRRPTLAQRFSAVIGQAKDMPADLSENHDYYVQNPPE